MRVVGLAVHPRVPHRHAAAEVSRGIVDQPFRNRPHMVPDDAPGARIQRVGIIGRSHEHDAVHHHRRHFQPVGIAGMEYPLRPQLSDIRRVDLGQAAEAAPREIPVIREPVCSGRLGDQLGGKHIDHCRGRFPGHIVRRHHHQAAQKSSQRQGHSCQQSRSLCHPNQAAL